MKRMILMPVMVAAAFLQTGCFTALTKWGHGWSGGGSSGELFVAGVLDVATSPIQLAVATPFLIGWGIDSANDYCYDHFGEGARLRQEREAREAAIGVYVDELTAAPGNLCMNGEFLNATNGVAIAAADRWIGERREGLTDEIRAAYVMGAVRDPGVLRQISRGSLVRHLDLTNRVAVLNLAVAESAKREEPELSELIELLVSHSRVTDEQLRFAQQIPGANERVVRVIGWELHRREEDRKRQARFAKEREERERRWREEKLRKEAEEKAFRERQKAQRLAAERERQERIRPHLKALDGNAEAMRAALAVREDERVSDCFKRRLWNRKAPIDVENLRILADASFAAGSRQTSYLGPLMLRPEMSGDDLWRYYRMCHERVDAGEWTPMWRPFRDPTEPIRGLVCNPSTPEDLLQATWDDPLMHDAKKRFAENWIRSDKAMRAKFEAHVKEIKARRWITESKRARLLREAKLDILPKKVPAREWRHYFW